jgi:hypothetical protein
MGPVLPYCRVCCGVLVPVISIYERGRPHGTTAHQLSYECASVFECRACGAGQVEKVRHDCFQLAWDYYLWVMLEPGDARSLRQASMPCRMATWPLCQCTIHRSLVESTRHLRCPAWRGLVTPDFASEDRLAANTRCGLVAATFGGLPVVIARTS